MPTANRWLLDLLAPLVLYLPTWPGCFPNKPGEPLKPLKVGISRELEALLPAGAEITVADLRMILKRFTNTDQYQAALATPGAQRHGIDGQPVGPVLADHARFALITLNAKLRRRTEMRTAAQKSPIAP